MGTGYTRQSAAEIAPGNTITALDLENEFDAIQAAMHATTGHSHDGTSGEGPMIALTTSISGVLPVANGGIAGIHKLNGTTAPTVNDDSGDGYTVGSFWIDTTNDVAYLCVDATVAAAIWIEINEAAALDAELAAIAGLTSAADRVPYFTGSGTAALATFTSYGRSLVAVASEAALKSLINLEAGTDFQAFDAGLTDIAALAVTDGNIIVGNGTNWVAESGATARTSLGLGTGNTPEFTSIQIGHATDTTLTRSSAGVLAVEGSILYKVGGTDVSLADGGTGASLTDPAADRVLFWDDSAGVVTWLTMGNNLTITGTTLDASGTGYTPGGTDVALADGGTGASLADPGADRILFWDDSGSAVTWLTVSTGLAITGTDLTADFAGVYAPGGTDVALADGGTGASLVDPNADRILFWDDSAGAVTWLTAGTGLSITTTTLSATGYAPGGTDVALADGGTGTSLSDPGADRILFWDDSVGAIAFLTDGNGITISGTSILVDSASETVDGIVELATTAEAAAGTDTTRAVTAAGLLAAATGQETIWIPAQAMVPNITNGPTPGTTELATNDVMLSYLAFSSSTGQSAQFHILMPKSWNESTLIAQFVWTHPAATAFGATWGIAAVAFANDDALDTAFGTTIEIDDVGGTTNDVYISDETAAITVAGTPGAEEYVIFRVNRDTADAGDTLDAEARLLGVKIHYTTNAFTDD